MEESAEDSAQHKAFRLHAFPRKSTSTLLQIPSPPWFHVRVVAALASHLMTMRQEYYGSASFETIADPAPSKKSLSDDQLRRVETLGKELARLKLELEQLLSKVQRNCI